MNESENFHGGHRERMIEKVCSDAQALEDHELLEILLFYSIPRKDTNLIAHRLSRFFGSIENVFSAKAEDLVLVDGIGKKTAAMLKTCGMILYRIKSAKKPTEKTAFSFASYKPELIDYFKGEYNEKILIILLDKSHKPITRLGYSSNCRNFVAANTPELVHAFAINKPAGMILAHNHPSGISSPSADDDFTTAKINMLCSMHGVALVDHIIVAGEDVYSYYHKNKLDEIKNSYSIENLLRTIKE